MADSKAALSVVKDPQPEYYTTGDLVELFDVNPRTIARWADRGIIPSTRTLGGHRRYKRTSIDALKKMWEVRA